MFSSKGFPKYELGTWLEAQQKKPRPEEMPVYPCDLV